MSETAPHLHCTLSTTPTTLIEKQVNNTNNCSVSGEEKLILSSEISSPRTLGISQSNSVSSQLLLSGAGDIPFHPLLSNTETLSNLTPAGAAEADSTTIAVVVGAEESNVSGGRPHQQEQGQQIDTSNNAGRHGRHGGNEGLSISKPQIAVSSAHEGGGGAERLTYVDLSPGNSPSSWLPFCEEVGERVNESRAWCIAGDFESLVHRQLTSTSPLGASRKVNFEPLYERIVASVCAVMSTVLSSVPGATLCSGDEVRTPATTDLKVLFAKPADFSTFKACSAIHGKPFVFCSFDCDNDASYVCDLPFYRLVKFAVAEAKRFLISLEADELGGTSERDDADRNKHQNRETVLVVPFHLLEPLRRFVQRVVQGEEPKACQGQEPPAHLRPCENLGLTNALKAVESTFRPLAYEPLCDVVTVVYSTRCPCCPDVICMVDRLVAIINKHRARADGEPLFDSQWSDLHCPQYSGALGGVGVGGGSAMKTAGAAGVIDGVGGGVEAVEETYTSSANVAAAAGTGTVAPNNSDDATNLSMSNLNSFVFDSIAEDNTSTEKSGIVGAVGVAPYLASTRSMAYPTQPICPCDFTCFDSTAGRVGTRLRLVLCNIDENDLGADDWPTNPVEQIVPHIRVYPATDLRETVAVGCRGEEREREGGAEEEQTDSRIPQNGYSHRPLSRKCPYASLVAAMGGMGVEAAVAMTTNEGRLPCLPMGSREYYEFLREMDACDDSIPRGEEKEKETQGGGGGGTAAHAYYSTKTGVPFNLSCEDRSAENVSKFIMKHCKRTRLSRSESGARDAACDDDVTNSRKSNDCSVNSMASMTYEKVLAECRAVDEGMLLARKKRARSDASLAISPSSSALDQSLGLH